MTSSVRRELKLVLTLDDCKQSKTVGSRGVLKPVLTLGTTKTPFSTCSRGVKPRFNARNYNTGCYNFNVSVISARYNTEVKNITPGVILASVLIPILNKLRSLHDFFIWVPASPKMARHTDLTRIVHEIYSSLLKKIFR